jgi:molybdopterin synthase sulfur carrier subunit
MRVLIPGSLRSYTSGASAVEAHAECLSDLIADLDRSYPGFRFRIIDEQAAIRRHIRIFVNARPVADLTPALHDGDEVMIVCALSGG